MVDMTYSGSIQQYVLLEPRVTLGWSGKPTLKYSMCGKGYSSYGQAKGARTQMDKPCLLIAKVKLDEFIA